MRNRTEPAGCRPTAENLVRYSRLFSELAAEREEILRHKWLESEKAGRDIGFEAALTSWVVHHRAKWRECRVSLALPTIPTRPVG